MANQSPCRISGVLAKDANQAVIFRRGPSKVTQVLLWDLNTDEVIPGQWLKGRIYDRRCDVSPDGKYLVIAASNYSRSHRLFSQIEGQSQYLAPGWTAISRPPYLTAIGLWLTGNAWNGGGIWRGATELHLNNMPNSWHQAKAPPPHLQIMNLNWTRSEDEPLFSTRQSERGWALVQEQIWSEPDPVVYEEFLSVQAECRRLRDETGLVPMDLNFKLWQLGNSINGALRVLQPEITRKVVANAWIDRDCDKEGERWIIRTIQGEPMREFRIPWFTGFWIDVDANGRIIFGDKGCLWAWADFPASQPKLIRDLNPNRFERMEAPGWALRTD